MSDERTARLRRLAWLLDSSIPIPGTRLTIGIEALLGLIPFAGDLAGVVLSGYIVAEAAALGASRAVLARMALNIAIEGLAGMVPLAGDIFDAAWKANQRNVRLLERWMEAPARAERASLGFVLGIFTALAALVAFSLALTIVALRWLVQTTT